MFCFSNLIFFLLAGFHSQDGFANGSTVQSLGWLVLDGIAFHTLIAIGSVHSYLDSGWPILFLWPAGHTWVVVWVGVVSVFLWILLSEMNQINEWNDVSYIPQVSTTLALWHSNSLHGGFGAKPPVLSHQKYQKWFMSEST